MLITDFVLLVTMLIGLLRLRRHRGGTLETGEVPCGSYTDVMAPSTNLISVR